MCGVCHLSSNVPACCSSGFVVTRHAHTDNLASCLHLSMCPRPCCPVFFCSCTVCLFHTALSSCLLVQYVCFCLHHTCSCRGAVVQGLAADCRAAAARCHRCSGSLRCHVCTQPSRLATVLSVLCAGRRFRAGSCEVWECWACDGAACCVQCDGGWGWPPAALLVERLVFQECSQDDNSE